MSKTDDTQQTAFQKHSQSLLADLRETGIRDDAEMIGHPFYATEGGELGYDTDRHECVVLQRDDGAYLGYVQTSLDTLTMRQRRMLNTHGDLYGPRDGWVGFDCAHAGDICTDGYGNRVGPRANEPYDEDDDMARVWDPKDVAEECLTLRAQLEHFEDGTVMLVPDRENQHERFAVYPDCTTEDACGRQSCPRCNGHYQACRKRLPQR